MCDYIHVFISYRIVSLQFEVTFSEGWKLPIFFTEDGMSTYTPSLAMVGPALKNRINQCQGLFLVPLKGGR